MPDDETLLYIHNDQRYGTYQEIGSLNVKDGREKDFDQRRNMEGQNSAGRRFKKRVFYLKDEGDIKKFRKFVRKIL